MMNSMTFPQSVPNSTSKLGKDFFYSHVSFTTAYNLKPEKFGLIIWLNSEAINLTVFTAMCPEE